MRKKWRALCSTRAMQKALGLGICCLIASGCGGGNVTSNSIVGVWEISGAPVGLDHVYGTQRDPRLLTREFYSSAGVRIVASRDPDPLGSRTCAKGAYSIQTKT